MPEQQKLNFSAPHRETYDTGHGWATCPWTMSGVVEARSCGMWFTGQEQFESQEVRRFALTGK